MTLDLPALRALCDAATKGPWRECGCGKCSQIWSIPTDCVIAVGLSEKNENYTCGEGVSEEQSRTNAAFVAAARDALPALLDRVAELEQALADTEMQLRAAEHDLQYPRD